MNILLTNIALSQRAGTETWVETMYHSLSKDHDVDVYAHTPSESSIVPIEANKNKRYSIALVNHAPCLEALSEWNIGTRVYTCHGVIPRVERPIPGANHYVSVSEEIQSALESAEFKSDVIRNPIDLEYFTPDRPVNQKLQNILYFNNNQTLIGLCAYATRGYNFRVVSDHMDGVRDHISWADLVIGTGRCVYESMAMNRNALVMGIHGCDGMATHENLIDFRKNNCSGRFNALQWDADRIRAELDAYNPEIGLRRYIFENNNVNSIKESYLGYTKSKHTYPDNQTG